ncbi:uncharacterized protein PV09_02839 [Verruconis gallopava]|uniref:Uncharacterized protein n=1 Tax=Verruconis gallopava TaxID=253628 RepID=A0A0D1XUF9_9PEZI|nr:uncharacterized protein PV09_02839 [Verruconis gallopava]KIW06386.1 hypothetical protein PV09_02839 [Verruconis gallopava]
MAEQPINPLEKIGADISELSSAVSSQLSIWKGNFLRNSSAAFDNMSPKQWIRLIIIVCTYLLIRPYLVKLGAKVQEKQMEKAAREMGITPGTKITANDLRQAKSQIDIPGVDSDSEDENDGKLSQWGRKQRIRQRKLVKRAMEIHEQNLAAKGNESDKDIDDLLED